MGLETSETAAEITQVMAQLKELSKKKDIVESAISSLEKAGIIIDINSQKCLTGIRLFGDKYALA